MIYTFPGLAYYPGLGQFPYGIILTGTSWLSKVYDRLIIVGINIPCSATITQLNWFNKFINSALFWHWTLVLSFYTQSWCFTYNDMYNMWNPIYKILIVSIMLSVFSAIMPSYIMALRLYSVLDILLSTIIIIIQECSQVLKVSKCLWSLSCGGVSNMLLDLSVTFHFHYYIWGCICSTGPFQFRWLKGYIHRSCYYHHQIGSINLTHCYHIFPWLCAWDVCYIIFCHLLHIYSRKASILFSLLLCSLWCMQIVRYILACRSCSFVCTLHHLIMIPVQTYLKTLNL